MREVQFRQLLDDANALRVRFEVEDGHVLTFVAQLECRFGDIPEWVPVIRYDTAHGFAHCDRLHPYDDTAKTAIDTVDYNHALTFALNDLKNNWVKYRRRYERWLTRE